MTERAPVDRACRAASWAVWVFLAVHVASFVHVAGAPREGQEAPGRGVLGPLCRFGWAWVLLGIGAIQIRSGRWVTLTVLLLSAGGFTVLLGLVFTLASGFGSGWPAHQPTTPVLFGVLTPVWAVAWGLVLRVWIRRGTRRGELEWIDGGTGRMGKTFRERQMTAAGRATRIPGFPRTDRRSPADQPDSRSDSRPERARSRASRRPGQP